MPKHIIERAADHFSHLLSQGKTRRAALTHTTQRFGVPADEILPEVEGRHEYTLTAEPITAEPITARTIAGPS